MPHHLIHKVEKVSRQKCIFCKKCKNLILIFSSVLNTMCFAEIFFWKLLVLFDFYWPILRYLLKSWKFDAEISFLRKYSKKLLFNSDQFIKDHKTCLAMILFWKLSVHHFFIAAPLRSVSSRLKIQAGGRVETNPPARQQQKKLWVGGRAESL